MNAILRGFWQRVLLAWALLALILIGTNWSAITGFILPDPDDVLRLVQVRDLLAGQGWFDLAQHRIDAPAGVATHWSRLVDIPIALVVLVLRPWLGQSGAELFATVAIPLLTLLCAMVLSVRLARRLFGDRAALFSCLAWVFAIAAQVQLRPLRIDHHGWQIVAELAAINGLLASTARRGGWIIGIALGLGLTISLELLPFVVVMAGVLGLRWLRDRRESVWLVQMLLALNVTCFSGYLLSRGLVLDSHCDTITPSYLLSFALAAILTRAVAALEPLPRPLFGLALATAAVLSGAFYLALSPACLAGPFSVLDPLVRKVWYVNVLEGQPIWLQDPQDLAQLIAPAIVGLIITALAFWKSDEAKRAVMGDFTLVLAGSVAVAVLVARFSAPAAAIATIPLGYGLSLWTQSATRFPLVWRVAALPLIVLALVPTLIVGPVRNFVAPPPVDPLGEAPKLGQACGLPGSIGVLNSLPRSTIFAPFEIGPMLLLHTPHTVIATGHHRAAAQMGDTIRAFSETPERAEALVRAHHAHYVMACADMVEARNYLRMAPKGLMAQLLQQRSPAWLRPVPLPKEAGSLRLWLVVPDSSAAAARAISSQVESRSGSEIAANQKPGAVHPLQPDGKPL